jgi:hypothetical protein
MLIECTSFHELSLILSRLENVLNLLCKMREENNAGLIIGVWFLCVGCCVTCRPPPLARWRADTLAHLPFQFS